MDICITCAKHLNGNTGKTAKTLADQLKELDFNARYSDAGYDQRLQEKEIMIEISAGVDSGNNHTIALDLPETPLEQALRIMAPDFDTLPLLTEGESKIIRQWNDKMVIIRPKPTVYSYSANRYGVVPGTDCLRMKFSAALFRKMAGINSTNGVRPRSAFLSEIPSQFGSLLVERKVETCNLEVRVKRYHIGSPIHRYRYTENIESTQTCGPIKKWSRFDTPVVCFDWRHPLLDEEGNRLADEPISDDYAAVWMNNTGHAKEMARQTFLWMEDLFARADLCLIDMCLFIDREGHVIYGEISPDCMRVRFGRGDPSQAQPGDKDVWRAGSSPAELERTYTKIYQCLFEQNMR